MSCELSLRIYNVYLSLVCWQLIGIPDSTMSMVLSTYSWLVYQKFKYMYIVELQLLTIQE